MDTNLAGVPHLLMPVLKLAQVTSQALVFPPERLCAPLPCEGISGPVQLLQHAAPGHAYQVAAAAHRLDRSPARQNVEH